MPGATVSPVSPASPSTSAPSPLRAWWLAIRPNTLPAAVAPVAAGLGAALSVGTPFRLDTALACLAVALLLQIAANLANDLSDFQRGADTPERTGPTRVAAAGLVTPAALKVGIAVVLGLAGLVGLFIVLIGGVVLLVMGALAMVSVLAYTGGPWPYGYRGLGEVFVFIFFGLVAVAGTAWLQALRLEALFILAAIPVGALVTAILVVNNLRDVPTDRLADKRTLAVVFGEGFAKVEYVALVLVAAAMPVLIVSGGWAAWPALLPLVAMPLAAPLVAAVRDVGPGIDRRSLNRVLKGTARLALAFSLLLGVGLALGGRGGAG
jgi:1,4-dihydroxy-2-naphthoate octaprenyltransferase